jgi:hypothetical protein
LIALEPEAASIYIRNLKRHQLISNEDSFSTLNGKSLTLKSDIIGSQMHSGSKYIVVDCGGGTVDLTVHELIELADVSYLKELYKASGGL